MLLLSELIPSVRYGIVRGLTNSAVVHVAVAVGVIGAAVIFT